MNLIWPHNIKALRYAGHIFRSAGAQHGSAVIASGWSSQWSYQVATRFQTNHYRLAITVPTPI